MSDLETKTFSVGENIYAIRYSSYGCYMVEETLGISCTVLMKRMQDGTAMFREVAALLLGGLEGARKAHKQRHNPFTIEEVCDILDLMGVRKAAEMCLEHFTKSFIASNPEAQKLAQQMMEEAEKAGKLKDDENPTEHKDKTPTKDG